MARTLSDTLLIAVIEATTRLTGARGPIAGSGPSGSGNSATTSPSGEGAAAGGAASAETAPATPPASGGAEGASGAPSAAGDRDTRSAQQIADDFKTIYAQVEALVKESAEQETKSVGFGRAG